MSTHRAAECTTKGTPFAITHRPTPTPGPGELLIAVKSVGANPADGHMRDAGVFISSYPTVIGFDLAGLVLSVGEGVPATSFQPDTRVAAYSATVFKGCDPDYGAYQERCLVPWQQAVPLPPSLPWNDAVTFPVGVEVATRSLTTTGIPRDVITGAASCETDRPREALLIWGASSSVGSMGVQIARLLREAGPPFAAVYATAGSEDSRAYVAQLGADRVFDYKDPDVVKQIVAAARGDGVVIRRCFLATGQLALCQHVLGAFVGEGSGEQEEAIVASAQLLPANVAVVQGVKVAFVQPPADEGERLAEFAYWGAWLGQRLAEGAIRASPPPTVVGKGLEFLNEAVDRVSKGVRCTKLVVEVGE